jgi:hypothetical protein
MAQSGIGMRCANPAQVKTATCSPAADGTALSPTIMAEQDFPELRGRQLRALASSASMFDTAESDISMTS